MRRIKILLLLHSLAPGGAPKTGLEIFEELKDQTCVRIISHSGGAWSGRCRKLGRLCILKTPDRGSRLRRFVRKSIVRLHGWAIRRWKPDLIYANSVASLPLVANLDLPKVPSILHVHEIDSHLQFCAHDYADILRDWPDRYIAVTDAVRKCLVGECGVTENKISVIHSFLGEAMFGEPIAPRSSCSDRITVGGVGFLCTRRGAVLWLQMAAELAKILGDSAVRFVWVGVDDKEEGWQFREIARKLKVDHLIDFVAPTHEPMNYFKQFDVFAMTSWAESFSLVVVEQMVIGRPVVCFAGSGGPPEVVGDTGIVIEDFSPLQMAEAIAQLARDPERMEALGIAARKRAFDLFHVKKQVPKIFEEIRRLVDLDADGREIDNA